MSTPLFDTTTPAHKSCEFVVTCFQNSYFDFDKCDCVCYPGYELTYVSFSLECVPIDSLTTIDENTTPPLTTTIPECDTKPDIATGYPKTTNIRDTLTTSVPCQPVECNIDNSYFNTDSCNCECMDGFKTTFIPAWPSYTYKCEPIVSIAARPYPYWTTAETTGFKTNDYFTSTTEKACDYVVTCFQNSYFDFNKCDCVCYPGYELIYVSFSLECVSTSSRTSTRPLSTRTATSTNYFTSTPKTSAKTTTMVYTTGTRTTTSFFTTTSRSTTRPYATQTVTEYSL
jgi:hypothetical protein